MSIIATIWLLLSQAAVPPPEPPLWTERFRQDRPGDSGQYVFMKPDRTGFVVRFPGPDGFRYIEIPFLNRTQPSIRLTDLRPLELGRWEYRYQICNGPSALDPIEVISFPIPRGENYACAVHEHPQPWRGPCRDTTFDTESYLRVHPRARIPKADIWLWREGAPKLTPGACIDNFIFRSDYLPGILTAVTSVLASPFAVFRDLPQAAEDQVSNYTNPSLLENQVMAVGPAFRADSGREAILANYRHGIAAMTKQGALGRTDFVRSVAAALEQPDRFRLETLPPASNPAEAMVRRALGYALGEGRQ